MLFAVLQFNNQYPHSLKQPTRLLEPALARGVRLDIITVCEKLVFLHTVWFSVAGGGTCPPKQPSPSAFEIGEKQKKKCTKETPPYLTSGDSCNILHVKFS